MISKTPNKKTTHGTDHLQQHISLHSSLQNSNESQQDPKLPHERSIFQQKQEQTSLKNSQILQLKKTPKGVLGIGRKLGQPDNIFRKRSQVKQYREVVMSDQFVRSSKLYKILKEQVQLTDAKHMKEIALLQEVYGKSETDNKNSKTQNHQTKLQLWELRNQLIQLKSMYEEQEEENRKLVEEYEYLNKQGGEEEDEEREQEGEENQNRQGEEEDKESEGQQKKSIEKEQMIIEELKCLSGIEQPFKVFQNNPDLPSL